MAASSWMARLLSAVRWLVPALMFAGSSAGCFMNAWHEEHFSDHRSYVYDDAARMRSELSELFGFLKSIGLKRVNQPDNDPVATTAVFIRDYGDHFHITVTASGLALVNRPGWAVVAKVESYNIGEEGAENAGHNLLKEIDDWKNRPSGLKAMDSLTTQPGVVGEIMRAMTQPSQ